MSRRKIFFAFFAAPLSIFCGAMAMLSTYGHTDHAQNAAAIVIFGARVHPGGVASSVLRFRTRHAFDLWKRGLAPKIICTGGVGENPPSEAIAEADLLKSWGVPENAILRDETSTSTRENAQNSAALLPKNARVIAVSDPYHVWRARRDLEKMGLVAFSSPALEHWEEIALGKRLVMTAREVLVVARDLIGELVRGE